VRIGSFVVNSVAAAFVAASTDTIAGLIGDGQGGNSGSG
jgi:hypothetical protein